MDLHKKEKILHGASLSQPDFLIINGMTKNFMVFYIHILQEKFPLDISFLLNILQERAILKWKNIPQNKGRIKRKGEKT